MQKLYWELGPAVERIYPGFNEYEGTQLLGGRSNMTVLNTTARERRPPSLWQGPIYTGELRRTVRRDCCLSCSKVQRVGAEERYRTIEELKAAGCPRCGGRKFLLERREQNHETSGHHTETGRTQRL